MNRDKQSDDAHEPATSAEARFRFVAKDLRLEFAGSREYVDAQIDLFRDAMRRALGYDAPQGETASGSAADRAGNDPSASGSATVGSGRSDLEGFLRGVRTRVGRGALQERILLFIYYLTEVRDRGEVGTEDINFCFDLLGLERPRSLANTLGIMKRNQAVLDSGSRRGTYNVTDKGRRQVKTLLLAS